MVRLVAALGYFHLSDYAKALDFVLMLNPGFNQDPSTSELLQELERLNVEINGNL